jgi:hypothetical protein
LPSSKAATHLQDWVPTVRSPTDVDPFVKGSLPLRICRDVANLTKHFVLERTLAQGHELSVLREYAGPGKGWFEGDAPLVIVTNYKNPTMRKPFYVLAEGAYL